MSTKKIRYAIIQQDESGCEVMFKLPLAALYYESKMTTVIDELRVDVGFDKIITKAEDNDLIVEQMIFSLTDKIDYVRWVKQACKVKAKI